MDETIAGSIDRMKEKALRNERQDKDDLLSILSLDSKSEESFYLAKAAKDVALESTGRNPVSESPSDSIIKKLTIEKGFEIGTIDDFRHIMPYDL